MAKAKLVTYFKSALEDKPGALLAVAKDLKSKNLGQRGAVLHSQERRQVPECCQVLRHAG
jgi:hypothetical protein